ncbi:MAG: M56 family metallopeptidase [Acidobacteriota bacterium]
MNARDLLLQAPEGSVGLLEATGLLLLALLWASLTRRASAASRHGMLAMGMGALVLLPAMRASLPEWRLTLPDAVAPAIVSGLGQLSAGPDVLARMAIFPDAPAVEAKAAAAGGRTRERFPWFALLAGSWAVVSVALLLRTLAGFARMIAVVRRSVPGDARMDAILSRAASALGMTRMPRVSVSRDVDVPMACGVARPAVIVPAASQDWSDERLFLVFLHELGHLRRRDHLAVLAARVVTALYWFHPLVWVAERMRRREAEHACDDLVLETGARPSAYAAHLVAIARDLLRGQPGAAVAVAMASPPLGRRIVAILDGDRARAGRPVVRRAVAAVFGLLLVPVATVRIHADETPTPPAARHHHQARPRSTDGAAMDAGELFQRGLELHGARRYDEAIAAWEKSIELGYSESVGLYDIACARARKGDKVQALETLGHAVEAGFDDASQIENDDDLATLRGDSQFTAILKRAEEIAGDGERIAALRRLERIEASADPSAEELASIGTDLLAARQLPEAVRALERAASMDRGPVVFYNLACAEALSGATERALDALADAIASGWDDADHIAKDTDLDALRGSPRYAELVRRADVLSVGRFVDPRRRKEWPEAVKALEALVAAEPSHGAAWFALGWGHHASGDHARAAREFAKAADIGYRPGVARYNVACAEARVGHADAAFEALARAEREGFDVASQADHDEDLDSLRTDPRFDPYRSKDVLHQGLDWLKNLL